MALKAGKKRLLVNLEPDVALYVAAVSTVKNRSQSAWINDLIREDLDQMLDDDTRLPASTAIEILIALETSITKDPELQETLDQSAFYLALNELADFTEEKKDPKVKGLYPILNRLRKQLGKPEIST